MDDNIPDTPSVGESDKNTPFLRFETEYYNPSGNPLQDYLFHPATLAAIQALGPQVLQELVPQGGFDTHILNMQLYNERMAKSMADKVDYLSYIDNAQIIIDFGCADGKLIKYLQSVNPNKHYIGYDISQPMLDLAQEDNPNNITFTNDWQQVLDEAKAAAQERGTGTTLVFSSILHEIYHYLPKQGVDAFWSKVFNSDFDNIAIRDMMTNRNLDRPAKPEDVQKIRDHYDEAKIAEWENRWGSLSNQKSLVHFLLTCPYKENWARELQEDYLPMPIQDLIEHIPPDYEIAFMEHYTLPYLKEEIANKQFGIDLDDNTHMKLILRKARRNLADVAQDKRQLIGAFNEAAPSTKVSAALENGKLAIIENAQNVNHQQQR